VFEIQITTHTYIKQINKQTNKQTNKPQILTTNPVDGFDPIVAKGQRPHVIQALNNNLGYQYRYLRNV